MNKVDEVQVTWTFHHCHSKHDSVDDASDCFMFVLMILQQRLYVNVNDLLRDATTVWVILFIHLSVYERFPIWRNVDKIWNMPFQSKFRIQLFDRGVYDFVYGLLNIVDEVLVSYRNVKWVILVLVFVFLKWLIQKLVLKIDINNFKAIVFFQIQKHNIAVDIKSLLIYRSNQTIVTINLKLFNHFLPRVVQPIILDVFRTLRAASVSWL